MIDIESNEAKVFQYALGLVGYNYIKDILMQQLYASESYTESQKYAIRICADSLKPEYITPYIGASLLNQILNIKWQDINLNENALDAMSIEQRIGLASAVVAISKGIVQSHIDSLSVMVTTETSISPTSIEGPAPGPTQQL